MDMADAHVDRGRRHRYRATAGAATAALIAGAAVMFFIARQPLWRLSRAVGAERRVEGRIVGLRWGRFDRGAATRGAAGDQRLVTAAWAVLTSVDGDTDADSRRVSAVVRLLLGEDDRAARSLDELLGESPRDARVSSDAAVAHLSAAEKHDRPVELAAALASVDRALRIEPRMPEALFNRALVLERLGVSRHAANAWRRFLEVEPSGQWADEARSRLRNFDAVTLAESYKRLAPAVEKAALAGPPERVRALIDGYRQEARTTAEADLGRWAKEELSGHSAEASRVLAVCRAVGEALQGLNSDEFLAASVAAIDGADSSQRALLLRAHSAYDRGRSLLSGQKASEAEPVLDSAMRDFEAANSPQHWAAVYFRAIALAAMHRPDDSYEILQTLAQTLPAARFRSLDAQIHWDLGLAEVMRGNWTPAARAYQHSADGFASLGETGNLGFVESLLAEVSDYLGDRETAWRRRVAAFPLLTRAGRGNRLQVAIGSAARAELRAGFTAAALPLFDLEIAETAFASGAELRVASAYARRAMLYAASGDPRAAEADLVAARASAAKIPDVGTRSFVDGTAAMAEAILIRSARPRDSLAMLDRAAGMYAAANQRIAIPRIQLERARAFRALGDENGAIEAYRQGIDELERQRRTVADLDQRVGVFNAGEDLFVDATALLVRQKKYEEALQIAERARARTLVESTALRAAETQRAPISLAELRSALSERGAVVEYAITPERLVIFAITRDRFDVSTVDIREADLRGAVNRLVKTIRGRAPMAEVEAAATRAYDVLIRPVESSLRDADTIVFVPARFLQVVPFATLRSGERFVIQDHAVVVSPSARTFDVLRQAHPEPAKRDALVFGNPSTNGAFEALYESEREARNTAAAYPRAELAVGASATRSTFFALFGESAAVHFAGHAEMDPARGATAALAFSGPAGPDFVAAHEIARTRPAATRLVVLAACDTFVGEREHFEGTPTLAHAFLSAGVPSVVGTLWPVGDAASRQLFGGFHSSYSKGIDSAESLRRAQLTLLGSSDGALRHPASWCAAEVLGSPSSLGNAQEKERR